MTDHDAKAPHEANAPQHETMADTNIHNTEHDEPEEVLDACAPASASSLFEILEIDHFETAFPVSEAAEEVVHRRYTNLFVSSSTARLHGSNGFVVRTTNGYLDELAVKMLHPNAQVGFTPDVLATAPSEAAQQAFRAEYEAMRHVSRLVGFPEVYGYGVSNGTPAIVMEWIDGISLAEFAKRFGPRLSWEMAANLGRKLFNILAHMRGLTSKPVHRDLSPHNLIIRMSKVSLEDQLATGEFDLYVIDFGSMTVQDAYDPRLTSTTGILRRATPEYAPPEMLADSLPNIIELRQSPAIDTYAACSIVYELIAGKTPFALTEHLEESPYELKTTTSPQLLPAQTEAQQALACEIARGLLPKQEDRPNPKDLLRLCEIVSFGDGNAAGSAGGTSATAAADTHEPTKDGAAQTAEDTDADPGRVLVFDAKTSANGGRSIFEPSIHHTQVATELDGADSSPSASGTSRRTISRRGFIAAVAAGCGAIALGGFGAFSLFGANNGTSGNTNAANTSNTSSSSNTAAQTATYTGGSLYGAQDAATGLWGYVNAQRLWVIEPRFAKTVGLFSDGLACVTDDETGLCGYINPQGEWVIKPQFTSSESNATMFSEGLALAHSVAGGNLGTHGEANRVGWIDKSGAWVIEPRFYGGTIFKQGLAGVVTEPSDTPLWGFVNTAGNVVVEPFSLMSGTFSEEGLAPAKLARNKCGWVDTAGSWAIAAQYPQVNTFSNGLAGYMADGITELWGFLNEKGEAVIEPQFASVRSFVNDLAPCKDHQTQLWGLINKKGSWVVKPKFTQMGWLNHGLAPAQDPQTGLYGYVDDTGEWVIPAQFKAVNFYQPS